MSNFNREYYLSRTLDKSRRDKSHKEDIKFLSKHSKLFNKMKILDIGCEDGAFLSHMSKYCDIAKFGLEINEYSMNIAKKNGVQVYKKLEECNEKFDLIVMRGVLHHIYNPFEMLEQCLDKLNDKGSIAILQSPNSNSRIFKKFLKLPLIEESPNFAEIYWIPNPQQLEFFFIRKQFICHIEKPYLRSVYFKKSDLIKYILMLLDGRYRSFSWFNNVFRLIASR